MTEPLPPLREPPLRPDGRFAVCPGCGERDFPPEGTYCPTCGHPLTNPCLGLTLSPAQRGYLPAEQLPHFCRASERFCGQCGAGTSLAFDPPLRRRAWQGIPVPDPERLYASPVVYPRPPHDDRMRPARCPACGSARTGARLCPDCGELLLNLCPSGHTCAPGDRYCPTCGRATGYLRDGWLQDYPQDPVFLSLTANPQEDEHDTR